MRPHTHSCLQKMKNSCQYFNKQVPKKVHFQAIYASQAFKLQAAFLLSAVTARNVWSHFARMNEWIYLDKEGNPFPARVYCHIYNTLSLSWRRGLSQTDVKRLKNLVVENWPFRNTGNLFCPWISQNFKSLRWRRKQKKWRCKKNMKTQKMKLWK